MLVKGRRAGIGRISTLLQVQSTSAAINHLRPATVHSVHILSKLLWALLPTESACWQQAMDWTQHYPHVLNGFCVPSHRPDQFKFRPSHGLHINVRSMLLMSRINSLPRLCVQSHLLLIYLYPHSQFPDRRLIS